MAPDLLNIALAFIEGFALIISPCILPILPIVLTGSLTGSKARPLGIIIAFILVFSLFTLFSRTVIQLTHIDTNTLRNISYTILIMLGIVMMSSTLSNQFNLLTQRLTNVGGSLQSANDPEGGFWGGILFGSLIAIIWTPCAGPILAAVVVQIVIQQTTWSSIFIILAFALGAALPMLFIAMAGRAIMNKFSFFRTHSELIRKILGFLIIISVMFAMFFPTLTMSFAGKSITPTKSLTLQDGLDQPYTAPEIAGITAWINSEPLTLSELKGKVVLIDFWTYSCINCIRTLPYLKEWYEKYHDKGFVIIGVHSPEFSFEQSLGNVKEAATLWGISYPIALDNNFVTWRNYNNQYWPAHYLIDRNGKVVYQHFGEGKYDVTEDNIRYLLGLSGAVTPTTEINPFSANQTPETYFGYRRAANFASPEIMAKDEVANYTYPKSLGLNKWALNGKWLVKGDNIVAQTAGASIKLNFHAGKVFVVMGAQDKSASVQIKLNGELITDRKGADVKDSEVQVTSNKLYRIVALPSEGDGVLEIIAKEPGLELYTFTFGK